jgi:hypothetical protein
VPKLAIGITTFYRQDKFLQSLSTLCEELCRINIPGAIYAVETSILPDNLKSCETCGKSGNGQAIWYLHNPLLTQSEARNLVCEHVDLHTEFIGFIDNDIYLGEDCLNTCIAFLETTPSAIGVAPVLRAVSGVQSTQTDGVIIMPNEHARANAFGHHNGLLCTYMLRGAYFLRRRFLSTTTYPESPFLADFTVWQNVPLFQTLRESKELFGYLEAPGAVAFHDSRRDNATITKSMGDWMPETLKSIMLLFYRNRLWEHDQSKRNMRFINRMCEVLADYGVAAPRAMVVSLMGLARCLHEEQWSSAQPRIKEILGEAPSKELRDLGAVLMESEVSWPRMQRIQSNDLAIPY